MTALSADSSSPLPQQSHTSRQNLLSSESKQVRELLPADGFHHFNDRGCLLTIQKTKYRCVKLKIDILDTYPTANDSLIIELTSEYLSERLVKLLYQGMDKIQKDNIGKPRIFPIVESLHEIIQNNKLAVAYDEVHKIKKMFKKNKDIELKVSETSGKLSFKIRSTTSEYTAHFKLEIPDWYPLQPVSFSLKACSFPKRYQNVYTSVAQNLCEKRSKGFEIAYILGVRDVRKKEDTARLDLQDFNSQTALDIRKDLKTMHKMSLFHNTLMDKKGVRKKVRSMNKQAQREEQKERELRKEMERACVDPNAQHREPLPSLLVCVEYLVTQFSELPLETCGCCKKNVFPKHCKLLQEWEDSGKKYVNKGKYPQRADCGHWYHHKCLEEYLDKPPFGKNCCKCEMKLQHHMFETDVRALERQWAVKQAKKRELDDVGDFVSSLFD